MKLIIGVSIWFCLSGSLNAQDKAVKERKWYVPDYISAQYAGSIGVAAAGIGYDVLKGKGNIDILVGYLPGFTGSKSHETTTLKFTFKPFTTELNSFISLYPLNTGAYLCYTYGLEFYTTLPSWYPDGYYWWSESIRLNIFIGGGAKITMKGKAARKSLTPYYEIGTNELKLISYVKNASTLPLWEILHVGIGVRYHF
jgi:hypothetical protein